MKSFFKKHLLVLSLLAFMVAAGAAVAAMDAHDMQGGAMSGMHAGKPLSEAGHEYVKAMDGMHGSMMEGITDPDPDAAFVRGMIPHHRGAVDMARIELKYGKDPELRKLAQDIIDAQEKEIRFMEDWLKKRSAQR